VLETVVQPYHTLAVWATTFKTSAEAWKNGLYGMMLSRILIGTTWCGLLGGSSDSVQLECNKVPRCGITVGLATVGEVLGSWFPGGRSYRKMFPDLRTQPFPKRERGMV
jgi:hypothetical protein